MKTQGDLVKDYSEASTDMSRPFHEERSFFDYQLQGELCIQHGGIKNMLDIRFS
jgi:hypothetical protein